MQDISDGNIKSLVWWKKTPLGVECVQSFVFLILQTLLTPFIGGTICTRKTQIQGFLGWVSSCGEILNQKFDVPVA